MFIFINVLLGLCLGSFFNVMLTRDDWYKGSSRCDTCGYALKWYDLIPVLSYLCLKGRCRKCHSKISIIHLASEIFMGCGFAVVSTYYKYDLLTAWTFLTAVIFLGICAISDTHSNEVAVLYLYGGIFCLAAFRIIYYICNGNIAGLLYTGVISVAMYIVFCLLAKIFDDYIGSGDFDMIFMLYLVSGVYDMIACITIASVMGTCLYFPLVISGKYDRQVPLPLAPLFYVAFVINLVFRGGYLI